MTPEQRAIHEAVKRCDDGTATDADWALTKEAYARYELVLRDYCAAIRMGKDDE